MKTKNYKFRASYSILRMWEQQRYDDAVKMLFHLSSLTSPAIEAGKAFHKEWEEHIKKTGCLPDVFGGTKLKNPIVEKKYAIDLKDSRLSWMTLVCRMDCETKDEVIEFKTGTTSSAKYANEQQIPMYALIREIQGRSVKKGIVYHYDQYAKKSDMSIVWITPKVLKIAADWIEGMASSMHNYLVENGLYEQLTKMKEDVDAQALDEL